MFNFLPKSNLTTLAVILTTAMLPTLSAGAEPAPRVAVLNELISTSSCRVVIEKVVLDPDEESLYPPRAEHYGMPVAMEYGRGPVVVVKVELPEGGTEPGDVLEVRLSSDGRQLQRTQMLWRPDLQRQFFGFNFRVAVPMEVSPDGSMELHDLGELTLQIEACRQSRRFDLELR